MKTSDRVNELARIPMNEAPWKARELIKFLSKKYGVCGELYLHAYNCYAKYVENTEGGDDDDEARNYLLSLN